MIIARCPAITAAGVKMSELLSRSANRFALMFLLNVCVKRIQMKLKHRAANICDEFQALINRIEKIGFEPIQRLDADNLSALLRHIGLPF